MSSQFPARNSGILRHLHGSVDPASEPIVQQLFALHALPQELIDLVVDALFDDIRTLKAFRLASRRSLHRSKRHLFRRLICVAIRPIFTAYDALQLLAGFFLQNPQCATFVRSLSIQGEQGEHGILHEGDLLEASFFELLNLLPLLEELYLSNLSFRQALVPLLPSDVLLPMTELRTLEMHSFVADCKYPPWCIIQRAPEIQTVVLDRVSCTLAGLDEGQAPPSTSRFLVPQLSATFGTVSGVSFSAYGQVKHLSFLDIKCRSGISEMRRYLVSSRHDCDSLDIEVSPSAKST